MVRFRDGKPTGIYFSQHSDGAAYQWNDATLSKEDDRVSSKVTCSVEIRTMTLTLRSSHLCTAHGAPMQTTCLQGRQQSMISDQDDSADPFYSRTHVHDAVIQDYCDAGQRWDPVSSAYFYRFDTVTSELAQIFPPGAPQGSNFTSAIYFSGLWGDTMYPDSDPRQKIIRRFGLRRYVSGPTGPMSKQLVRKALFPDHREPKSWLQWGVGVVMALYPCCLRGWRIWVSGAMLIAVLVSIVVGIIFAIRRYRPRKKGYEKVNTGADVPLNDLRYRDDGPVHGRHSEEDSDKLS